ncbi:hypothetical protein CVT24_010341 [Panaeolus cyanescens]|uniref:J domain-containing protein n=1 Tax=Panaeolus cyanescens TaxID=181874 RepID=A0A409YQE9_9AGAR|nr:hypothetical protein CVT24_010341 [Panaeolus cyanescens]
MHFRPNLCQAKSLQYWVHGQPLGWMSSLIVHGRSGNSYNHEPVPTRRRRATWSCGYATVSSAGAAHTGPMKEDLIEEDEVPLEPPKFPYPKHKQPTPHEIFHLRYGASQAEIKARYFELVRIHHPDSVHVRRSRIGAHDAHNRFRNIKAAYDFLQGRTLSPHPNARPAPEPKNFDPYMHELARRRRSWDAARGASRAHGNRGTFDDNGAETDAGMNFGGFDGFGAHPDERGTWNPDGRKERLMLWAGVVTLVAGLFPSVPGTVLTLFYQPTPYVPLSTSSSPSASTDPSGGNSSSPPSTSASASSPTNSPSTSSITIFPTLTLTPSLDKSHREAAKALSQARSESREMGAERRDGIRKRVRDMNTPIEEAEAGGVDVGVGRDETAA